MDLKFAHIWAAKYGSRREKESIFLEQYDDDEKPISAFAESQDEWFYDHDFFFIDGFAESVEQLFIEEISGDRQHVIVEVWKKLVPDGFRSVVVGDSDDFENPKSCKIGESEFIYIGEFPFF